ncbi:3-hydroxyacyl-CoA dehydrogenase NAD-binding domain-containing protein, partial [Acinetobacter sp. 163]|nr:3-hydroxyacyl-CoA dehydrogenase NAD-binding domain-containing protein [Acinetobacter sp. 163]
MAKVAVIGSGLMGGGIAQACAVAGYEVVNLDIAQEPLDRAQALVVKLMNKKVAKGKMTQEACD